VIRPHARSFQAAALIALAALAALGGCRPATNDVATSTESENVLRGTVSYRERIALPPQASVEVRIEDVSIADAPAVVVAQLTIVTDGRQVPIPFALRYTSDRVDPSHRYGVRAAIKAPDGTLMFTTTSHQAVPASSEPAANVDLLLQRAGPDRDGAAVAPLPSETWRLVAIQRPGAAEEPVAPEPAYTIEFGADGRFAGRAYCNRYAGAYQQPEPGRLTIAPTFAATLAACPPPSIADEFMRAIGAVTRYELRGDQLRLSFGADGVLTFTRAAPTA